MTLNTALEILFPATTALFFFTFYICCGYVRMQCSGYAFSDEEFGSNVRGVLAGVARLSFWLCLASIIKMFV